MVSLFGGNRGCCLEGLGCMGGGVAVDGSNMIYDLEIFAQQSYYFTIYDGCHHLTALSTSKLSACLTF